MTPPENGSTELQVLPMSDLRLLQEAPIAD